MNRKLSGYHNFEMARIHSFSCEALSRKKRKPEVLEKINRGILSEI